MNQTLTLTPKLQIHNPNPAPARLSLTRVIWYKFLRWIEKSSPSVLLKSASRAFALALIVTGILAPSFTLGYLTEALQWNSYRIPICIAAVALTLNAKRIYLWLRRRSTTARGANQHTYNGLPVSELAEYLLEARAFKREEAIKRFALSQGQYSKIAQELEDKGVLVRGEANARVLRDIGRANLVRQLRDGFPLVWDPNRDIWVERNSSFDDWTLSREFKQRKLTAELEKKQRRLDRLEERIGEAKETAETLESPLARVFARSA